MVVAVAIVRIISFRHVRLTLSLVFLHAFDMELSDLTYPTRMYLPSGLFTISTLRMRLESIVI